MSDNAKAHIAAGFAAIKAAKDVAGSAMQLHELIGALVAIAATRDDMPESARDRLAEHLTIDAVQLVGVRRAHELTDLVAARGVGARFS
jgi:hypothetical protein